MRVIVVVGCYCSQLKWFIKFSFEINCSSLFKQKLWRSTDPNLVLSLHLSLSMCLQLEPEWVFHSAVTETLPEKCWLPVSQQCVFRAISMPASHLNNVRTCTSTSISSIVYPDVARAWKINTRTSECGIPSLALSLFVCVWIDAQWNIPGSRTKYPIKKELANWIYRGTREPKTSRYKMKIGQ